MYDEAIARLEAIKDQLKGSDCAYQIRRYCVGGVWYWLVSLDIEYMRYDGDYVKYSADSESLADAVDQAIKEYLNK